MRNERRVSTGETGVSEAVSGAGVIAGGPSGEAGKRYACAACPYATDRRDLFTRHENIHRDEKPFHCYLCQKQFNRADHVKKHFLRMHRDQPYDLNRIRRSAVVKTVVAAPALHYYSKPAGEPPPAAAVAPPPAPPPPAPAPPPEYRPPPAVKLERAPLGKSEPAPAPALHKPAAPSPAAAAAAAIRRKVRRPPRPSWRRSRLLLCST